MYAELEDDEIQETDRKMKERFPGETIFEEFIERIDWIQEEVAVQYPYTPAHIVSMAYANIEKCGLYQDDFREWSQKPRLEKNWSKFKANFARVLKETLRSSRTSNTEGYAANVQSIQANTALFTKMYQELTLALANLVTATQANRTSVALLTKAISYLSTQVTNLTVKLTTAHFENARLKKSGHRFGPS